MKLGFTTLLAALALATVAFAGGPIVVVEEQEVVVEDSTSGTGMLPLLLIPVALCVIFCQGDGS